MAWTREEILAVRDLPLKQVTIDAWEGAVVWLRTMSAAERDRYILLSRKTPTSLEPDLDNFKARLLVFCISDEWGTRMFRDDEADLVGSKCPRAIAQLYDEALRMNSLAADSEAEAVEEARKNS
jgi:hypothetical protein